SVRAVSSPRRHVRPSGYGIDDGTSVCDRSEVQKVARLRELPRETCALHKGEAGSPGLGVSPQRFLVCRWGFNPRHNPWPPRWTPGTTAQNPTSHHQCLAKEGNVRITSWRKLTFSTQPRDYCIRTPNQKTVPRAGCVPPCFSWFYGWRRLQSV